MKVSISWLKELVDLKLLPEELANLLSLKTIGIKEVTPDFIELDMKGYNRSDLLSLRGVAVEVAAITDSKVKFSEPVRKPDDLPEVKVSVEDKNLVPLYCLAKIEGLKVERSNPEWVKKLTDSGMRPVNNVADITNLVMLEYGQPLHAFDASTVKNETVVVRLATPGESLESLDEKSRTLVPLDLVIADEEKALGIAGVMGGKNSEVTENTQTILLEAAIFDPVSIRKTATRLGLNSEASKRFQHGLSKTRLLQALDAAIRMYEGLGGKLTGLTIIDNTVAKLDRTYFKPPIYITQEQISSLIGVNVPGEKIEEYFDKFHFTWARDGAYSWHVNPPYWRGDIEEEVDLVEEVARMYGYDKVPSLKLSGETPPVSELPLIELINKLSIKLVQLGLTEVQTYSYFSTKSLEVLGWKDHTKNLVKVANPMSAETTYLRQNSWINLIEVIDKNIRQNNLKDIAIFEVGKVFSPEKGRGVKEVYSLSVALMNGSDNPIAELNSIFSKLNEDLKLSVEMKAGAVPEVVKDIFHPVRFIHLLVDGKEIGGMSEVHPRILDKFGINKRVSVLEIYIEKLNSIEPL